MANLIPGLPNDVARECLIRIPFQSFPSAILTCKDWKREIESSQFLHRRIMAGCSQPIMVMIQAKNHDKLERRPFKKWRFTVVELKTGNWGELPPFPGFLDGLPIGRQLAVVGSNLVAIGGFKRDGGVSCDVFIYNFVSGTWRRGEDMPEERKLSVVVSDSDRMMYVVGGLLGIRSELRSALAYDVVKDKWVRLPDMAMSCLHCDASFQCGRLHVIGGCFEDVQGNIIWCCQAFDPATWTWGPVQCALMDSNICRRIVGAGEDGRYYSCQDDYVTVLEKGKWVKAFDLPVNRRNSEVLMPSNRCFAVIGSAWGREYNKIDLFDLETKKWTKIEVPIEYAFPVGQVRCLEI